MMDDNGKKLQDEISEEIVMRVVMKTKDSGGFLKMKDKRYF